MKKTTLYLCRFLGVLLCLYTLVICLLTNFNIGNILSLSFGIVIAFIGFFSQRMPKKPFFLLVKAGICVYLGFFIFMSFFIFINSKVNTTDFTEDAVIVLGCAVHGETPSPTLYNRLENALIYAEKNPDALIIVSGGQGPQEKISEAEAMSRYLKENGIDESRIVLEDKSTSTSENFKFSKPILDKTFPNGYTFSYITNDFHSYRAYSLAKLNGLNPTAFNCKTDIFSFVPLYLRECLAVIKLWVFKY